MMIYDVKNSDTAILRLRKKRAKEGVEISVIGKMARHSSQIAVRKLPKLRLHTRMIIRDKKEVFMGSQSMRELELDSRREIGIIFRAPEIACQLIEVFQDDWKGGVVAAGDEADDVTKPPAAKVA